jgi:hypothetical protein
MRRQATLTPFGLDIFAPRQQPRTASLVPIIEQSSDRWVFHATPALVDRGCCPNLGLHLPRFGSVHFRSTRRAGISRLARFAFANDALMLRTDLSRCSRLTTVCVITPAAAAQSDHRFARIFQVIPDLWSSNRVINES